VLIRPGSIPKTTSGKIQRNLARRMWLQNSFKAVDMLST
jgi:acyl-coenzyme A synthetase/AMP-(fatty) acid ligase